MITYDDLRTIGMNIRVHGNGFIQIDTGSRTRVHVLGHPAIPRQISPTPIHDHRFSFHSAVLSGCLVNVDWRWCNGGRPHTHALCVPRMSEGEDTKLELTGRTGWVEPVRVRTVCPRESYTIAAGALHETFANEPTVTLMTKTGELTDYEPRVLCRIGREPDNEFNRYTAFPEDMLWNIVQESFRA